MKSIVELVIHAPQTEVARLYCDPRLDAEWMVAFERVEPVAGDLGATGSVYRLVPKEGDPFVTTVVQRRLPVSLQLRLEGPKVAVDIHVTFEAMSADATKFLSQESFTFRGVLGWMTGLFARRAIHRVHREQMESFKRFAERRVAEPAADAPART